VINKIIQNSTNNSISLTKNVLIKLILPIELAKDKLPALGYWT